MKITFLPFLTQIGLKFWPIKVPNVEFLKQHFDLQLNRETQSILLQIM